MNVEIENEKISLLYEIRDFLEEIRDMIKKEIEADNI